MLALACTILAVVGIVLAVVVALWWRATKPVQWDGPLTRPPR